MFCYIALPSGLVVTLVTALLNAIMFELLMVCYNGDMYINLIIVQHLGPETQEVEEAIHPSPTQGTVEEIGQSGNKENNVI